MLPLRSLRIVVLAMIATSFATASDKKEELGTLVDRAEKLKVAEKFNEAAVQYQQAIELSRKLSGADHVDTATLMYNLGALYLEMREYKKAEPLLVDCLKIAVDQRSKRELAVMTRLLGRMYVQMGRSGDALPVLKRSLELLGTPNPEDLAELMGPLNEISVALQNLNKYKEAEPYRERLLAIAENVFRDDESRIRLVVPLNDLAVVYLHRRRFAEAEKLYERSLKLQESAAEPDPKTINQTHLDLAILHRTAGQFDRARVLLEQCFQDREKLHGKNHPTLATIVEEQGKTALEGDDLGAAERFYRQSIRLLDHPRADPKEKAYVFNMLSVVHYAQGRYMEAEGVILQALKVNAEAFGEDDPHSAYLYQQLGSIYKRIGQYRKAERAYLRSLNDTEKVHGDDDPNVAICLHNLALLYHTQDQHERAEPLFQQCLKIQEKCFEPDSLAIAHTLKALGGHYMARGEFADAAKHLERALAIREKKLNPHHRDVIASLGAVAELHLRKNAFDKAEPLLQRCLESEERNRGNDPGDLAVTLERLADLKIARKEWVKAGDFLDRSSRARRSQVQRMLPGLSDAEQIDFLASAYYSPKSISFSFGLQYAKHGSIAEQSAAWVLNSKGVAQDVLAQRGLSARDRENFKLKPLLVELQRTRTQLALLTVRGPGETDGEKIRVERDALAAKERETIKEIGRLGGKSDTDDWVDLKKVRDALPRDGVLVEIARFGVRRFGIPGNHRDDPDRYVAWIIPPSDQGEIAVVDLGEAAKIESAVTDLRRAFARVPYARGPGLFRGGLKLLNADEERASAKDARTALAELSTLILKPLKPYLENVERWFLSPDQALWIVPWAALGWTSDEYLVEKHSIQYLVSGRDLMRPASTRTTSAPLVLADPNYNLGLRPGVAAKLVKSTHIGPEGWLYLPRFGKLDGTAEEARSVQEPLRRFAQAEPIILTDADATETAFKRAQSPRVVLLSTHGFFCSQETAPSYVLGQSVVNPLLKCGLVLAGANRQGEGDGDDDGVLTGLEILGVELRGTELVVLSACETALGDVHSGEGVAGLRQAFQLAGARDVLATLWKVPDSDTAIIMSRFFEHLATGKRNSAEALRQAQRDHLTTMRQAKREPHPFYWAAFTMTGPGASGGKK